jgi:flavodoxin
MKSVFVYYSLTGNGDYVASLLKNQGVDSIKLETKRPFPKNIILQMIVGGGEALFHKKAKLKISDFDLSSYDEVILGTPIWDGRPAPAMNTFLEHNPLAGKTIVLVSYSGSGDARKCEKNLSKLFPIKASVSLKEPSTNKEAAIASLKTAQLLK